MASQAALIGTDAAFTLPDGRSLAYREYGLPDGPPVFFCHGTPGSRVYRHPDPTIPTAAGVRLIAVDRPGYGRSTFQPGRRLLDWPRDLAALADHLGLGRFAVVGLSGGGPHALACAYALADRLTQVGLAASAAPFDIPDATVGMGEGNRTGLAVTRALPFFALRAVYGWAARSELRRPEQTLDRQSAQFAASDRAVREQPGWRAMEVENVREAYRQGARGHAWEGRMVIEPWGFRCEDIAAPIHLWQGEADTLVPPTMGRYLARTLPRCEATFLPEVGHLALFYHYWQAMLTAMAA